MPILLIISAVILMYYRTFNYSYIIDDLEIAKPKEQETKNIFKRFWEHLLGIKYTDSRLAHIITTTIHCLTCIMIYLTFGKNNISFVTALLFALNPVNNMAAVWLSGKPYAACSLLLLIGLYFSPIMPILYGFCVWWAPSAMLFPFIYLMHTPHLYTLVLLLIFYLCSKRMRRVIKDRLTTTLEPMTSLEPKKAIIVLKTLGYYFKHCLFPLRIGMCHSYLHTFGLSKEETDKWYGLDKYFFIGLSLCILGVVALFNMSNPLAYGLLWFLFLTIQWCNLIMVNHPITERYIYLSNIGLMYALSNIIIGTPFMWIFLTFYAVRLFYFLPAYRDVMSYWKSNTENFPNVAMGYNQYGLGLVNFGNVGSAIDVWIRGVQERPHDFRINYNLSNIMLATGNTQQAVKFLQTAELNLDKKNNYDFWMGEMNKMKEEIRRRGVEYNPIGGTT